MNRDSFFVYIETPSGDDQYPCITSIPLDSSKKPIWTGIQEPTLSVLKAAYEAQKDNIVVIPDPVPVPLPVPQPDWDGFMTECSDVLAAGMQANYLVFTQIFNMLLALKGKGALDENSPEWRNFAFNYQIGKASLTPEQIAQVESSMANNNIPVLS